ncbi:hypothetical protein TorRG33x02_104590 [Trema orientale]|uniref:Uncharacterized protein n=1 Tax=Trema orientale TaxID=63057 RepID=A0A2P5F7M1_TREOI|nr:hypothetical protein TorRG33x02_104590 [Trema orientale]
MSSGLGKLRKELRLLALLGQLKVQPIILWYVERSTVLATVFVAGINDRLAVLFWTRVIAQRS